MIGLKFKAKIWDLNFLHKKCYRVKLSWERYLINLDSFKLTNQILLATKWTKLCSKLQGSFFLCKRSQYIESGPDIKFQWISVRPSVAVRCLFKSLLDSLCQWRLEIVIGVWKDHGSTAKTVTQAHNQVGSYA